MAWSLTGEVIETCSCNMLCPCWYGVKELMIMDRGWCASPILFRINQGSSDGVDIGGTSVVFAGFYPGPTLLDGNGTARVYVDERASSEQQRELEAIFQARKGGPMEVPASLIATWLPTRAAPIDVREQNGVVRAKVGDVGEIVSERLVNEEGDRMTMQNAGFILAFQMQNRTVDLAPSQGTWWKDSDFPESWDSLSGAVGQIAWRVD